MVLIVFFVCQAMLYFFSNVERIVIEFISWIGKVFIIESGIKEFMAETELYFNAKKISKERAHIQNRP